MEVGSDEVLVIRRWPIIRGSCSELGRLWVAGVQHVHGKGGDVYGRRNANADRPLLHNRQAFTKRGTRVALDHRAACAPSVKSQRQHDGGGRQLLREDVVDQDTLLTESSIRYVVFTTLYEAYFIFWEQNFLLSLLVPSLCVSWSLLLTCHVSSITTYAYLGPAPLSL